MKARLETAHCPQVQRQEIEEQCPVRLRGQRHHFSLLILSGMVVDPLQVGGLSAQTWTVVHELAVNFASGEIDKRHWSSTRIRPRTYSTRYILRPALAPPSLVDSVPYIFCMYTHSVREIPLNPMLYFLPMPPVGNV